MVSQFWIYGTVKRVRMQSFRSIIIQVSTRTSQPPTPPLILSRGSAVRCEYVVFHSEDEFRYR